MSLTQPLASVLVKSYLPKDRTCGALLVAAKFFRVESAKNTWCLKSMCCLMYLWFNEATDKNYVVTQATDTFLNQTCGDRFTTCVTRYSQNQLEIAKISKSLKKTLENIYKLTNSMSIKINIFIANSRHRIYCTFYTEKHGCYKQIYFHGCYIDCRYYFKTVDTILRYQLARRCMVSS